MAATETKISSEIIFICFMLFQVMHCAKVCLTHYQTTKFRLFQTERVCRRQLQIWQKWQKVIQTGRKQCFQKACFPGASKGVIVWEWVNSSPHDPTFNSLPKNKFKDWCVKHLRMTKLMWLKIDFNFGRVGNSVGKGQNAGYQHFLLFPQCFQKASTSGSSKVVIVL